MFDVMHRKYTCRYNDKLRKLIAPWQKNLFVSHFCYYKITDEGNYTSISSNVAFAEFFFDQKLHFQCPYLVHPKHFQSGISLTKIIQEELFLKQMALIEKNFQMKQSITIIQKESKDMHGFLFATHLNDKVTENFYINELPLLNLFINRFKKEFQSIIQNMNEDMIYLPPHVGPRFHKSVEMIPKISNRKEFLKDLGVQYPKITRRESDVLRLIATGMTSRDIATTLLLSTRTIEKYIEILRGNFLCDTKYDLEVKAFELKTLGII